MARRLDPEEIKASLPLSDLIGRTVTWDRSKSRRGDMWACCPFHQETTPSFHVVDDKGFYKCFGCHETGDHFTWAQRQLGATSFREALKMIAEITGTGAVPEGQARARPKTPRRSAADDAADRRKLDRARSIWNAAEPDNPFLYAYLRSRGVDVPAILRSFERLPRTLRFHRMLDYWGKRPDGSGGVTHRGPAMIAKIGRVDEAAAGVHRTWIECDGRACDGDGRKLDKRWLGMPGEMFGKPVELGLSAGSRMIVGEGIETVLAVWSRLLADGEIWRAEAAISRGALTGRAHPDAEREPGGPAPIRPDYDGPGWRAPDDIDELVILAEGSRKSPDEARRLTLRAVERHRFRTDGSERQVRYILPGDWSDGLDFADVAALDPVPEDANE